MTSQIANLADIVRRGAAAHPFREAIRCGAQPLSYAELDNRSSRLANSLRLLGVGRGDRVALLAQNSVLHFELRFAVAKLGAIDVNLNWRLSETELREIITDAEPLVLLVGPGGERAAERLVAVPPRGVQVVTDHESLVAVGDPGDPLTPVTGEDVCALIYSSGTTGRAKGVMISHRSLLMRSEQAGQHWGIGPGAVVLGAAPLFHIGGQGWALNALFWGARVVLLTGMDAAAIVDALAGQRVSHAFVVPAVLQAMNRVPGVADRDYSRLELIGYGSSPIAPEVLAESLRIFPCQFAQAYGMTETAGSALTLPPADHRPETLHAPRFASAGRPNPGVELRIVSTDALADVPAGEPGEVWLRTPHTMAGYWRMPEETARTVVEGGWLRTGDIGYLDADGYLYLQDRLKDVIVSGGENVYPRRIEEVLRGHPAVADVAVIGVPSQRWGETAKAVIVASPGASATEAELIAFCRLSLAGFSCPTSVDWVDALPANGAGKVLKRELRARYWAGRARSVG